MTKKDYELFANELYTHWKQNSGTEAYHNLIRLCSNVFSKDNQLFNPDKFERACYEGKHIRKSIKGTKV